MAEKGFGDSRAMRSEAQLEEQDRLDQQSARDNIASAYRDGQVLLAQDLERAYAEKWGGPAEVDNESKKLREIGQQYLKMRRFREGLAEHMRRQAESNDRAGYVETMAGARRAVHRDARRLGAEYVLPENDRRFMMARMAGDPYNRLEDADDGYAGRNVIPEVLRRMGRYADPEVNAGFELVEPPPEGDIVIGLANPNAGRHLGRMNAGFRPVQGVDPTVIDDRKRVSREVNDAYSAMERQLQSIEEMGDLEDLDDDAVSAFGGRGLKRTGRGYKSMEGRKDRARWISFGAFDINLDRLDDNQLRVRYASNFSSVSDFPAQALSAEAAEVLRHMVDAASGKSVEPFSNSSIHAIADPSEKELLLRLVARGEGRRMVKKESRQALKAARVRDIDRLRLLCGEVTAGNDSVAVKHEARVLARKLKRDRAITMAQFDHAMEVLH